MNSTDKKEPAPLKSGGRYAFIDLLRGFALVVMIETHVVVAYLPAASQQGRFYFWLAFVNGLVAPTFLFASGFSIMLQGSRQWENWLFLRAPFWRQMRRLGFVMLVAYFLHLQPFRLSAYLRAEDSDLLKNALQVDVLQCIVASLLVVHVLIFLLRKPLLVAWAAILLAVLAAALTPWLWSRDFTEILPLAAALFLNPHGSSLFPLFPWTCFILAGSCASFIFLRTAAKQSADSYMNRTYGVGVMMILGGLAVARLPFSLPGYQDFFLTSPGYVLIRLGCVLILCATLYGLEKRLNWVPTPIQLAGQESLLVYGVHLWVIFGLLRGKYSGRILGTETGYLGCILISAALILFMLWLARKWRELKHLYPVPIKRGQAAVVMVLALAFLLR